MPSPGLFSVDMGQRLVRWTPSLLLLIGALLEVVALVLPGVGLGWVGALVLILPLLAGRPHQPETPGDVEPSEIHPPGAV